MKRLELEKLPVAYVGWVWDVEQDAKGMETAAAVELVVELAVVYLGMPLEKDDLHEEWSLRDVAHQTLGNLQFLLVGAEARLEYPRTAASRDVVRMSLVIRVDFHWSIRLVRQGNIQNHQYCPGAAMERRRVLCRVHRSPSHCYLAEALLHSDENGDGFFQMVQELTAQLTDILTDLDQIFEPYLLHYGHAHLALPLPKAGGTHEKYG